MASPMLSVVLPLRSMWPPAPVFTGETPAGRRSSNPAARAPAERERARAGAERRLLYVEDNPADVDLVREALASLPYPVAFSTAGDGEQALSALHEAARRGTLPNVILLDLNLPRMSGHEVLARLRMDPALSEVTVIVLTSSSATRDSDAALAHADGFVTKPLDVFDYFSAVQATARRWLD